MHIHIATINPDSQAGDAFSQLATAAGAQIEPDPVAADAILFVDLHEHSDPFLSSLRRHGLVRRHRSKVFVYDQRDQPIFTFPGIYVSGSPVWARRFKLMVGGPYAQTPLAPLACDVEPDLLFSFLGSHTHPIRSDVMALVHERALVRDTGAQTYFELLLADRDAARAARSDFQQIVARSKFVLCPRGYGPSTYRIFETLEAGRVPVVLSDEWLPPPRVDWDRCIVRIAQSAVADVPGLLECAERRWDELVGAGQRAVANELGPAARWRHYSASLADLAARPRRRRPWWAQRRVIRIMGSRRPRRGSG